MARGLEILAGPGLGGLLATGAAAMVLSGCSLAPDPKAEAVAKAAYVDLVRHDDAALDALLAPAIRGPKDTEAFAMMRGLIPSGPWRSVQRTNWRSYAGTNGSNITYEHTYTYDGRAVTATSVLVPSNFSGGWALQGFHVNVTTVPG